MTPQQVSQALASQLGESQLGASLGRLFHWDGKALSLRGLRRAAAKIRREVCRKVSKAIRKMDPQGEPHMAIVVHPCTVAVPVQPGVVVLLLVRFAFFVSVGFVHMVEPVVTYRFG